MKVTEWNGGRSAVGQPQVILPEGAYSGQETIVVPSHPVLQYPAHQHPSEVIIENEGAVETHEIPMQAPSVPFQPAAEPLPPQPATEPIPMPASELPMNPGLPMPPSA
jgi:hypothetical protein